MFGKLLGYQKLENRILLQFEEKVCYIEIMEETVIRIFASLEEKEQISYGITELSRQQYCNACQQVSVQIEQREQGLVIKTGKLWVEVNDDFKVDIYNNQHEILCRDYRMERESFMQPEAGWQQAAQEGHTIQEKTGKHKIQVIKTMEGEEVFYGLGDKTGFLNKRGYEYEMWNSDIPDPHVDSFRALYKSIPFFITMRNSHFYGIFFDNPHKSVFDMGKESEKYYFFGAEQGNLDYYFMYGNTMADVLKSYMGLTGTHPLPQLWTLGYHQSRWSYETSQEVREIAKSFRENDIPCDCIHLDIDYMDGCRVFTYSPEGFPDMKELIQQLNQEGFQIVTIIDPGVKLEEGYPIYDQGLELDCFVKDKEGTNYTNWVWPGTVVYPDFSDEKVRSWWGENHRYLIELGVSGIWNDMNEPASFHGELPDDIQFSEEGQGADHRRIHNVYGHLMSQATYEAWKKYKKTRPFVITRACYAGTQRYATAWTGDNHSIWAHLQMAVPQLCNLGLSGMAFVGTDVGGFGSDCTPELLCRWVQTGCFSPLFRNHSCKGSRRQEPWAFNQETLDINRKYIKLRYRLLPYFYDLFWEHERNGLPVIRPLVLEFPEDRNTWEMNDQFMVGSHILVAPVVNQGQRMRLVYLPEGIWEDYWTGERHVGGTYIKREAPLEVCPMYIKAGTILPNYPEIAYTGEKKIKQLILEVYEGEGEYYHYQDNGKDFSYQEGVYNQYLFRLSENRKLQLDIIHQGYEEGYTTFLIRWKGREKQICFVQDTQIVLLDEIESEVL
ncbi:glycoside hydrolase family 31 protein [Anaeromicropila populeti]|uniref:Alpha-glucosidase n=1 Tax=Anaeromicropila populeti TaxID=37658 RepID=A0A1I6IG82_9FIRM|nr:TIM-barrel domain-containing protein [Anaeromicropila populeti]SFR65664.1 alpha-glucosidase [Anaeromicropila populeti]